MQWSIRDIARTAGVSSRTLRHYDAIGLLTPHRDASSGYRCYDDNAVVRLQRILLLRELGLGLTAIREVLDQNVPESEALRGHLEILRTEHSRTERMIAAVESTLRAREKGLPLMAAHALDGFDNTAHRAEVERRWGRESAEASAQWWDSKSTDERASELSDIEQLNRDWRAASDAGEDPNGDVAAALADRHVSWLRSVPGTPMGSHQIAGYLTGLGELYVSDERFGMNYGGVTGAAFVRDALAAYVRRLGNAS